MKRNRWKGHCYLCADNAGKDKRKPRNAMPVAVKRRLGQVRRFSRLGVES